MQKIDLRQEKKVHVLFACPGSCSFRKSDVAGISKTAAARAKKWFGTVLAHERLNDYQRRTSVRPVAPQTEKAEENGARSFYRAV